MFELSNDLIEEPSPPGLRLTSREITLAFPKGGVAYRRPAFVEDRSTSERVQIVDHTSWVRLAALFLTCLTALIRMRRK